MRHVSLYLFCLLALALGSCEQEGKVGAIDEALPSLPAQAEITPTVPPVAQVSATPAIISKIVILPTSELTPEGEKLIIESEVGGRRQYERNPHPEAPDARYSGITQGLGYDNSTVKPDLIATDWMSLGLIASKRLAATHPYTGKAAQQHLHEVIDITVPWDNARNVFVKVDIARVDAACKRTYQGFTELRPKAKDAVRSLVFNRGNSINGTTRTEMRDLQPAIAKQDYHQMAALFRKMVRVWLGTEIYNGMKTRRYAEAKLIESP